MKHAPRRLRSWLISDVRQDSMKRGVLIISVAMALLSVVWLFAPDVRTSIAGLDGVRRREGEVIPIATLKANELVVIAYRSVGCFHYRQRLYQVAGGNDRQFLAARLWPGQREEGNDLGNSRVIGSRRLTREEEIGLESYLLFLRRDYEGGCTTVDEIVVGYYRDGRKVGEERFLDATCGMWDFSLVGDRIVVRDAKGPPGFPDEVYREIVPPWLIEQRLEKRPNKAPEPTPGAVTPRATEGASK